MKKFHLNASALFCSLLFGLGLALFSALPAQAQVTYQTKQGERASETEVCLDDIGIDELSEQLNKGIDELRLFLDNLTFTKEGQMIMENDTIDFNATMDEVRIDLKDAMKDIRIELDENMPELQESLHKVADELPELLEGFFKEIEKVVDDLDIEVETKKK